MSLTTVELRDFRNVHQASLVLSERLTLIVGSNGQGKTNLLEAIYVLLQGRNFRTSTEREVVREGTEGASLEATGNIHGNSQSWSYTIPLKGRRVHRGVVTPVVLFAPDDVYLGKGSPERRRRFLDLLLGAHDSRYARSLRLYNHALLQRNRALKDPAFQHLIDDFTPPLIQNGLYLWRRRQEMVSLLLPRAQAIHRRLSGGEEITFELDYGGEHHPIVTTEDYDAAVKLRRHDEQLRQTTLVGPHRDDLTIQLQGRDTRVYASQGQLRSVALSLKLATYEELHEATGLRPIILLDDVLSELDPSRRQAVLATVAEPGQQTIVTDTEPRNYMALDPLILTVFQGEVGPWNPEPNQV